MRRLLLCLGLTQFFGPQIENGPGLASAFEARTAKLRNSCYAIPYIAIVVTFVLGIAACGSAKGPISTPATTPAPKEVTPSSMGESGQPTEEIAGPELPLPTYEYITGVGLKPKLKPIGIEIQTEPSDRAPFEIKKISKNFVLYTYSYLTRVAEETLRWLEATYFLTTWLTGPAQRPIEVHLVKDKAEYLQGSQRQIGEVAGEVNQGILRLYNPLGDLPDTDRVELFAHEGTHAVIATFRPADSSLWELWLPGFINEGIAVLVGNATGQGTLPPFAAKVYELYKTNSLMPFPELEKVRQWSDMPVAEREAYVAPGVSFVLYLRERFGHEIFGTFIGGQSGNWKERLSRITGYSFAELEGEWYEIVRKSAEAMAAPKAALVFLANKGVDTSDLWMAMVKGNPIWGTFVRLFVAYSREAALSDIGKPSQKTTTTKYLQNWPREHLSYDDQYDLFTQDLHGMKITLAIHKDWYRMGFSRSQAQTYFTKLLRFLSVHWDIFKGHPYDQFIIKIFSPDSDHLDTSATAVGFPILHKRHASPPWGNPRLCSHNIFHSWNKAIIMKAMGPDMDPARKGPFSAETWFDEGTARYYEARSLGLEKYFVRSNKSLEQLAASDSFSGIFEDYFALMNQVLRDYKESAAQGLDQSFEKLAEQGLALFPSGNEQPFYRMLYYRGTMVVYLLEREFLNYRKTLDDLMRYLYEQYGLTGKSYVSKDIQRAAEVITSASFEGFFNKYVYGDTRIPVNDIYYIDHKTGIAISEPQLLPDKGILKVRIIGPDGRAVKWLEVDLWTAETSLSGPPNAGHGETDEEGIAIFTLESGQYYIGFNAVNFPSDFIYLPPRENYVIIEAGKEVEVAIQLSNVP